MTARFILSLDCEGKWGVADHLGPDEQSSLTDNGLRRAYSAILRLLDEYDVSATFAFVGLFGESRAAFRRLRPEVERLAEKAPKHLRPALRDIDEGSREGWHGDWAVEEVAAARQHHEIALHGVTHLPWGDVDRALAMEELSLYRQLNSRVRHSQTFIYPRNQVAHIELLKRIAIQGYRLAPRPRSRVSSLASELNLLTPPEADPSAAASVGPLPIPAGYFVNWQHGPRRLVPQAVSRARLAMMLKRADRRGGVVHMWLHPENIATAEATLSLLRSLVGQVAKLRDSGRCEVLTQLGYVQRRRAATISV